MLSIKHTESVKGEEMCKADEDGRGIPEYFWGEGGEMEKKYMSKQIYRNSTKLVRLDPGWHRLLKVQASKAGKSIKEFLEEFLSEHWDIEKYHE